jgi:hypothetical protein
MRSSNPVYAHLTRNQRRPSLLLTLVLTGVIAVGGAALSLAPFQNASFYDITLGLHSVGWLALLAAPPITAVITSLIVAQGINEDVKQLLQLTPMTARSTVYGYWIAALFKLRMLYAMTVVLLPAVIIGTIVKSELGPPLGLWESDPFGRSVFLVSISAAALLMANLCAAALAIWLGFRSKEPRFMGAFVAFGMLIMPLLIYFKVGSQTDVITLFDVMCFWSGLLIYIAPLILTWWALRRAEKWV